MSDKEKIKHIEAEKIKSKILPPQLQVSETLLSKGFRIFLFYTGTNTGQI